MAGRVDSWLQRRARMQSALQNEAARDTINGGGKIPALDPQQVTKLSPDPKALYDFELLREREVAFVGIDEHLSDALMYGQTANRIHRATPKTPLGDYSDADLIMHMLNRGYAVLKCPNQPPEMLRAED